jgi:hypothetical protein
VYGPGVDPAGSHVPAEGSSTHNTGLSNCIKFDNLLEQLSDHQLMIKPFKDDLRLLYVLNRSCQEVSSVKV